MRQVTAVTGFRVYPIFPQNTKSYWNSFELEFAGKIELYLMLSITDKSDRSNVEELFYNLVYKLYELRQIQSFYKYTGKIYFHMTYQG